MITDDLRAARKVWNDTDLCHRAANEIERLQTANNRLRKIAAHVPAAIYIVAKEAAGYGVQVRPNAGIHRAAEGRPVE